MNALHTKKKTKGLLLDYDDTMARTEEIALGAAYDLMIRELGERRGTKVTHSKADHIDRFAGTTFREILSQLGKELDFSFSEPELVELAEMEVQAVLDAFGRELEPMPGSIDLLRGCQKTDILTAVVSSSATRRLRVCLEATGQHEFIVPHRVFSASDSMERPISKPDPAIYCFALSELGLRAEDVYAVEDSLSGCQSAVAAGIECIGFTGALSAKRKADRAEKLREVGAVAVFDSLDEVLAFLLREES